MALRLKPCFFKGAGAGSDLERRKHFLRDVARATSAAPTCFEPAKICTVGGSGVRYLGDDGVFGSDPALCACAVAARLGESPDDIIVASLGTGPGAGPIEYGKAKDRGMAGWAKPVMDVMMDGAADRSICCRRTGIAASIPACGPAIRWMTRAGRT